jgi:hypothetical protein
VAPGAACAAATSASVSTCDACFPAAAAVLTEVGPSVDEFSPGGVRTAQIL